MLAYRKLALGLCILMLCGCTAYVTPGRRADFAALGLTRAEADALTEPTIAEKLSRQPAASFPTSIAFARVQGHGYRSASQTGYGSGRFTLVTVRDAEDDTDIDRLVALPMVRGLTSINRLMAPPDLSSEHDLREIAAELQADMLLLYTFETTFEDDRAIPLAGTITLGLFPSRIAKCRVSAQAILVDTRTGYVYAATESAAEESRRTNIWNSDRALERARLKAEGEAFHGLVDQLCDTWVQVVATYGPPAAGG